jgi:peptidoglycan lytic transglycosylase
MGAALGLLWLSSACVHRAPVARRPPPAPPVLEGFEGIASWYGRPYHGRATASGEIYNMYDLTAAHRTLPFGMRVRVHDLENGRDVLVRINDRGPFVEGRIIDLSYAAAQAMGMPSTALVRLEILGTVETPASQPGVFAVQVGAFKDRSNAERLRALIVPRFAPVTIQGFDRGDGYFYCVRVGHESSEDAARELGQNLRKTNLASDTFVVRLN